MSVGSLSRLWITIAVELEDALEDDYPTDPHARSVEDGFDSVLDSVEELDRVLDTLANVAPANRDRGKEDNRNEIDYEGQPPRHNEISSGPEQPSFGVIENVTPALSRILLVPIEVEEDRCGDEQTGEEHRANERGK